MRPKSDLRQAEPRRRSADARRMPEQPGQLLSSGRGRIRPRARLIRTIGAELISSEVVAVLELVRNSYDADASVVELRFSTPQTPEEAALEIWDDGHGMSRDILLGPWLEPATAFKASGEAGPLGGARSPAGRRLEGPRQPRGVITGRLA